MKKASIIALLAIVSIGSLSADIFQDIGKGIKKEMEPEIKKTTVINNSSIPIEVAFRAAGCAGPEVHFRKWICHSLLLKPGQSFTYRWKWGQTVKKVFIFHPFPKPRKPMTITQIKALDIRSYEGNALKKDIIFEGE